MSFKLKGAVIEDAGIFSDAMSTDLVDALKGVFVGKRMETEVLVEALKQAEVDATLESHMDEIMTWVGSLPI